MKKDQYYANFITHYGEKLNKITSVLRYLNNHTHLLKTLKSGNLVNPEDLEAHQKEWVWVVSNYKGQEKEHFKDYWVPIERDNYSFFIDLSDDKLPLFETTYFIYEPYGYFNTVVFDSTKDMMLSVENGVDFEEIATQHTAEVHNNFKLKMNERNRLIFEGEIPVEPVNLIEIAEGEKLIPLTEEFDGEYYTIKCHEVEAPICGLLPYSFPVKLTVSGYDNTDLKFMAGYDLSIIKTIREFIHSIRMYRPENLLYYAAFISENKKDYIVYTNGLFKLVTSHTEIKEAFVKAYNSFEGEPETRI